MVTALVGHTGFVGSNLVAQTKFDACFNSSNIADAYGLKPDLLIYAGVRSEMFTANHEPQKDLERIEEAASNIMKIAPAKVVLISTVAVYAKPFGLNVNESSPAIGNEKVSAYGENRFYLEQRVRESFKEYLIVRLPAIYGINIKKNFIYDMIRFVPGLLKKEKYREFSAKSVLIEKSYIPRGDGFYSLAVESNDKAHFSELKREFEKVGFSALNFTDSRSRYQFYNLRFLWNHIQRALELSIKTINLMTEPLTAAEVFHYVNGGEFKNEISDSPYNYDLKTQYFDKFGGKNGYIFDKQFVLDDLKDFINKEKEKIEL